MSSPSTEEWSHLLDQALCIRTWHFCSLEKQRTRIPMMQRFSEHRRCYSRQQISQKRCAKAFLKVALAKYFKHTKYGGSQLKGYGRLQCHWPRDYFSVIWFKQHAWSKGNNNYFSGLKFSTVACKRRLLFPEKKNILFCVTPEVGAGGESGLRFALL